MQKYLLLLLFLITPISISGMDNTDISNKRKEYVKNMVSEIVSDPLFVIAVMNVLEYKFDAIVDKAKKSDDVDFLINLLAEIRNDKVSLAELEKTIAQILAKHAIA